MGLEVAALTPFSYHARATGSRDTAGAMAHKLVRPMSDAPETSADALIDQVISEGRYRVVELMGSGGMGAVYRGEHLLLAKRVAIKVLHPEMTRMPEVVARFEREARAAGNIEHPNVATATDFGKLPDGSFFLVLEYVEGRSLRALVDLGPLDPARAAHIARQMLAALVRAHGLGIVHRDLKPENVMLVERDGDQDFVKVLDFGIAKVQMGELAKRAGGTGPLTQAGLVYGTPEYMAPEQALGQDVDARADLYSLGAMLYEMLTGELPFDAASPVALLGLVVSKQVPPMLEKAPSVVVPPQLEAFTARLLAKLPEDRFVDARAALEELDAIAGFTPPPSSMAYRPPSRASLANVSSPTVASTALSSPKKTPPVALLAAAGAGAVLLLALIVGVALGRKTATGPAPVGSATEPVASAVAPVSSAATEDELSAAVFGGVAPLETLRAKYPSDARVARALAKAHVDAKHGPEAIAAYADLLTLDPAASTEKSVTEGLIAAVRADEGAATVPALEKLGELGADVLYELSTTPKLPPKLQKRAQAAAAAPDFHQRASKALKVTLELRAARKPSADQCKIRKALFVRAKEEGDARALPYLFELTSTRGCGFLKRSDCLPCLHTDGSLNEAIAAVRGRHQ